MLCRAGQQTHANDKEPVSAKLVGMQLSRHPHLSTDDGTQWRHKYLVYGKYFLQVCAIFAGKDYKARFTSRIRYTLHILEGEVYLIR